MHTLKWLQEYFIKCCNGDWEHTYQIKIETLDNPGWKVSIELEDTFLEDAFFDDISIERSDDDWIVSRVQDKVFQGYGGPQNLIEILEYFRKWVSSYPR